MPSFDPDPFAYLRRQTVARGTVAGGPAPLVLTTLTLSGTLTAGASSSGTINGATAGSTITTTGVTGFSVNSGARTYAITTSGVAGTYSTGLTETLSGYSNSPLNSPVTVISAVPVATFNPADKYSNVTLSNVNLTMIGLNGVGATQVARSTSAKQTTGSTTTGYVEYTINSVVTFALIGVMDGTTALSGFPLPGNGGVNGVTWRSDGNLFVGGSVVSAPTFTAADVVGMYVNAATGKVFFHKAGVWITATGNPSLGGAGASTSLAVDNYAFGAATNNDQLTANFGHTTQTYVGSLQAWGS